MPRLPVNSGSPDALIVHQGNFLHPLRFLRNAGEAILRKKAQLWPLGAGELSREGSGVQAASLCMDFLYIDNDDNDTFHR